VRPALHGGCRTEATSSLRARKSIKPSRFEILSKAAEYSGYVGEASPLCFLNPEQSGERFAYNG